MVDNKIKERAKAILLAHKSHPEFKIIEQIANETWLVRSPNGTYTITHDYDDGWNCNCSYFNFKGPCKHLISIQLLIGEIK